MSNNELAKLLIDTLPFPSPPKLFNPWRDHCPDCKPCNDPDAKLARLAAHLDREARFILCGEAPSHRGCRHSGIAFTSEYLLREGIPRIPAMSHRLTIKKSGKYILGTLANFCDNAEDGFSCGVLGLRRVVGFQFRFL